MELRNLLIKNHGSDVDKGSHPRLLTLTDGSWHMAWSQQNVVNGALPPHKLTGSIQPSQAKIPSTQHVDSVDSNKKQGSVPFRGAFFFFNLLNLIWRVHFGFFFTLLYISKSLSTVISAQQHCLVLSCLLPLWCNISVLNFDFTKPFM
jgi:hypothetical protein